MEDVLFIGPIAKTGGPAIKNRILVEHLRKIASLKIWNTYDKSIKARLGAITSILFAKQKYIVVAVSRKGRNLLYPFLLFKHRISGCKYSCVVIGGQAVGSFKNKSSITALHQADLVTVETEGLKAQMEKAYGLTNVHWMPNYKELEVDVPKVTAEAFQNPVLKLIFLSSMRDLKGVRTLFTAFQKCREIGLNVELDYYGPIKDDLDRSLLTDIENTEGVRYCGVVDNDKVLSVMSEYQVFVFPTEYPHEGFPAVLVEAQLVGLPVIASDINYNGEIIKDGINGFIFPHGDVEELVKKISCCYEHRDELTAMSRRNITDAKQYDAGTVISAYAENLRKAGWPG